MPLSSQATSSKAHTTRKATEQGSVVAMTVPMPALGS